MGKTESLRAGPKSIKCNAYQISSNIVNESSNIMINVIKYYSQIIIL